MGIVRASPRALFYRAQGSRSVHSNNRMCFGATGTPGEIKHSVRVANGPPAPTYKHQIFNGATVKNSPHKNNTPSPPQLIIFQPQNPVCYFALPFNDRLYILINYFKILTYRNLITIIPRTIMAAAVITPPFNGWTN